MQLKNWVKTVACRDATIVIIATVAAVAAVGAVAAVAVDDICSFRSISFRFAFNCRRCMRGKS